jgi:hypothetical protein
MRHLVVESRGDTGPDLNTYKLQRGLDVQIKFEKD